MISAANLRDWGARLAFDGAEASAVYDCRIDAAALHAEPTADALHHVRHQLLLRAYQSRYVLLPTLPTRGSILEQLARRYDPHVTADLTRLRVTLEQELIAPLLERARTHATDTTHYVPALLQELRSQPENAFTAWLAEHPAAQHHYRNFLIQSSADLLAEASASGLGVIGEFGPAQSALFRILIDEFGYGVHDKKHSVLYRASMRSFGLDEEYNVYWPLFDTATLELHNAIHYLFQNPRNFFLQVGFLLYAETAYQRSTADHERFLRRRFPQADARYFSEHAHIDLHHTRMVIDEVVAPLVSTYGAEVGHEIVAGAELTRAVFAASGSLAESVGRGFDALVSAGRASYGLHDVRELGELITPSMAATHAAARVQVGGIGVLDDVADFASFPQGAIGRSVVTV
jgi:hypothetical protein